MEIYLGVASFVYILQYLGKDINLSGSFSIMIWLPDAKSYRFSISAEDQEFNDCGYVAISEEDFEELFNKSDRGVIMNTCVRYFNKADNTIAHCSVKGTPDIKTNINEKTFRCLFR
jgi:hypothetical protein